MKPTTIFRGSSPVRARLARDLILLLVLTGGLLAALSAFLLDALRGDLAQERILATTAQVREEVLALVRPVEQQLLILRDGLDVAGIGPGDEERLNHRLIPILAHIPQIAGAEYFLRREGDGWLSRARDPAAPGAQRFTLWDAQAVAKHREDRASAQEPRTRPWFRDAIGAPGQVTWSAPYVFRSPGRPRDNRSHCLDGRAALDRALAFRPCGLPRRCRRSPLCPGPSHGPGRHPGAPGPRPRRIRPGRRGPRLLGRPRRRGLRPGRPRHRAERPARARPGWYWAFH